MQSFEEHTGSVICFLHYKGRNKKIPYPSVPWYADERMREIYAESLR